MINIKNHVIRVDNENDYQAISTEFLLKCMGVSHGDLLVDGGCGAGYGARIAAVMVGPDGEVIGIDTDPDLLKEAGRLQPAGTKVSFLEGDVRTLEAVPDGTAGGVLIMSVIHWVEDREAVFHACARVLRPGGCFGFGVDPMWLPNSIKDFRAEIFSKAPYNEHWRADLFPKYSLSQEAYQYLFTKTGFNGITTILKRDTLIAETGAAMVRFIKRGRAYDLFHELPDDKKEMAYEELTRTFEEEYRTSRGIEVSAWRAFMYGTKV